MRLLYACINKKFNFQKKFKKYKKKRRGASWCHKESYWNLKFLKELPILRAFGWSNNDFSSLSSKKDSILFNINFYIYFTFYCFKYIFFSSFHLLCFHCSTTPGIKHREWCLSFLISSFFFRFWICYSIKRS